MHFKHISAKIQPKDLIKLGGGPGAFVIDIFTPDWNKAVSGTCTNQNHSHLYDIKERIINSLLCYKAILCYILL